MECHHHQPLSTIPHHPAAPLPPLLLSPQPPRFFLAGNKFLKTHLISSFKFNNSNLNLLLSISELNNDMGLSPYSNPSDAGVLCVILVNTAMSISIMKEILCSILHVVGIRLASSNPAFTESLEPRGSPSEVYMEEFRNQTPSLRYISLCRATNQECSVCLTEFKPDAQINHLSCGHVFHKSCLEKWLKYWNITCPLCRSHMMIPKEVEENTCPM
ncbi:Zinc finger, RING/FYVE/PHD-type [Cynara cardunculus var. scolymus]|uniref:Zinc finger, RING/FYVE/PHD-type n=2 Tax=Cynara cardunculus var. scolymus TaxID=59895 RepID=A0A118K6G6_CYNCS|nr:Zinc finger, RING/FYVE/PHD-type [Cynara cardunculus var. scolymus]